MTSNHSRSAAGTDPGSRSSAELEHEVRESRADVERTLDALQDRLSPGQLVDQVAHYLGDHGGEFARNLGDTVKQNPVPVVLVGVGLAWMMLSGARRDGSLPRAADLAPNDPPDPDDDSWSAHEARSASAWDNDDGDRERGSEDDGLGAVAASVGEGLSEAAERAREGLSEATERTREGLREMRDGVSRVAGDAGAKMGRYARGASGLAAGAGAGVARGLRRTGARARRHGEQAREGFLETLHRQPLVLGAVGLAIGAAIGAALPPSRREDELMGDTSDQFRQHARAAGREEYAKAKATAGAAYGAARDEAEEQGLSREGLEAAAEAARDKVERVADAATEAAQREADRQGLGPTDPIA